MNYLSFLTPGRVFVGLLVLAPCITLVLYNRYAKVKRVGDRIGVMATVLILAALVGGMGLVFFTHSTDPQTIVVSEGKIAATYASRVFRWNWDRDIGEVISYREQTVERIKTVFALTENPSVRKVQIEAKVRVQGTPEAALVFYRSPWSGNLKDLLAYWLNEYEKSQHRWVATNCYNDKDSAQQQRFYQELAAFLKPKLEPYAVELVEAKFNLPNL